MLNLTHNSDRLPGRCLQLSEFEFGIVCRKELKDQAPDAIFQLYTFYEVTHILKDE